MTEYVGTRVYQAPELLVCGGNYTASIDVWSVGCIFAEMLGRKPIFPGRDSINQLKLILSILGTPHHNSDMDFIEDLRTINFIKTQHYSSGIPFAALYPRANPLALDLLQKMLVFNPNKRITISEALQHPYLSALYDPSPDPAPKPLNIDIDPKIGEIKMRDIMWREMLIYEPEIVFQHL
ncbi:hypothetical protein BVRB_6g129350 [Beta vulgaris subsp. vulgaris]|nr:hypothetical protein BVRB_6g129350 [Beta vulgaris subsp. vulgaris]